MNAILEKVSSRRSLTWAAFFFALLGVGLRLYRINQSDFVFYDEGYYLDFIRPFGEILSRHTFTGWQELSQAVWTFICICLSTGKTLWFLLVDSRMFFGGLKAWYFSREMAALFGLLTLAMIYPFARRYYGSRRVALLSVVLMAILPSQVFYSRVGFQETLSAFLVLAGFYFYFFPRNFSIRTLVAGLIFGAAFFSNYRLIILPALILVAEAGDCFSRKERLSFRKYLWCCLIFFSMVFLIGGIDDGRNTRTVFAWMFHQAQLAEGKFDPINFLSYPYYLFRLENFFLGIVFFMGNVYLICRRQWSQALPFVLVLTQMMIFSLAQEKGARYLTAVMPFVVISVAYLFVYFWKIFPFPRVRLTVAGLVAVTILGLTGKSIAVAGIRSDYRQATADMAKNAPEIKFFSTQPYIQNLFVDNPKNVMSCPHDFKVLVALAGQGYRYLVVDPQAYISWTKDEVRFLPELDGFLGFMQRAIRPKVVYRNFNNTMLERFVFEHSENLRRSILFLNNNPSGHYGYIYVYDLAEAVPQMIKLISQTPGGGHDSAR